MMITARFDRHGVPYNELHAEMSRVLLITSGAYIEPELEAEFGRLPPAFLPLGNRRLFAHQHAALKRAADRILLSIPEDFEPDAADLALLQELQITVVPVPPGLSLGQSIVYVMNVTASSGGSFVILHGDTLLQGIDFGACDMVSVEDAVGPGYRWGYVREEAGRLQLHDPAATGESRADPCYALTGFFAFADAARLVQSVTRCGGDFLRGLASYTEHRPVATLKAARWLDFGHASTYHRSRQSVTTQREFNTLSTTRRAIRKSGRKLHKIEAEARWFEALPPPMRVYTPAYLGTQSSGESMSYGLEYLHLPTLADLFVFGRLSRRAWETIFTACDEFLSFCAAHPAQPPLGNTQALYLNKTLYRLEQYAKASGTKLTTPCRLNRTWLPSLEQMARLAASAIPPAPPGFLTLIHGDFCFSNILYDFRAERVRVIDPRGIDADERFCVFGDLRYDIGKLHHSAVGHYDRIVANAFSLTRHDATDFDFTLLETAETRDVSAAFLDLGFAGLSAQEAGAPMISVLLFLSMLPLHEDDPQRQCAFLANAMRLFLEADRAAA